MVFVASSCVATSFVAYYIAAESHSENIVILSPFLILIGFWAGCRLFGPINKRRIFWFFVAMFLTWIIAYILLVPDDAFASAFGRSGYYYHKYDFRAHISAISVGLILLLFYGPHLFENAG